MKLTSTLLAAAVAAGLCSTAANADTLVYDTFETDQTWTTLYDFASGAEVNETLSATNGMIATDFRRNYTLVNGVATNVRAWVASGDNDTSVITNAPGWSGNFAGTVPGTNSQAGATTSAQYLALDTQGDTLSRTFDSQTISSTPIFVDTMIQFTASDGEPSDLAGQDAHIALWLDKDTGNLNVWGGTFIAEGEDLSQTNRNFVVKEGVIPGNWYRLTIEARDFNGDKAFKVYLDNVVLENDSALAATFWEETDTNKCWFISGKMGSASEANFSEVAFQGTGAVDNLTVTTDDPDFLVTSAGVVLTLSWDSTIASVTKDGSALNSGDTIESGDTITISAATWYALNDQGTNITGDVTVSNISGAGTTFGANDYTNLTVTLSASAAATATIKAAPYGAGTITAGTNSGIDASKAAAWAIAEGITTVDGFAAKYQQYLLNADADATVTFEIKSIETTAAGAIITVEAKADGTTITGAYNGAVKYQAADTIAGLNGATKTDAVITFENGIGTFTVPEADGQFVRAWVE